MVMRRLPHPVSRCEDTRVTGYMSLRWWQKNLAARIVCVYKQAHTGNNFAPPFAYIIKKLLLSDKNTHSLALSHSLTQAAVVVQ